MNYMNEKNNHLIALADRNGLSFYDVNDIIRCESDNSTTSVIVRVEEAKRERVAKIYVSKNIKQLEDLLCCKGMFFRIHNKHLINIKYINKYFKIDGGYLVMNLDSDVKIPVARARREEFIKYLKSIGAVL